MFQQIQNKLYLSITATASTMLYSHFTSLSSDNLEVDQTKSQLKMLTQDFESHQGELQSLAIKLEQQEQLLVNKINSIISFEPAVEIIIKITSIWIQLCRKLSHKRALQDKISIITTEIMKIQAESEVKKQMTLRFRDKIYLHLINDVKGIAKLINYAQKCNIKTIVQSHISQFVYSFIHSNRKCSHQMRKKSMLVPECLPGCQFGEFTHFLRQYKSQTICHKFKDLWLAMEIELKQAIEQHQRQFGQQHEDPYQLQGNYEQLIQALNTQQMSVKVDLEIITCEIKNIIRSAGFPWVQNQQNLLNMNFYDIILHIIESFDVYEEIYDENITVSRELALIFHQYVQQMTSQYLAESKVRQKQQQCRLKLWRAALEILKQALQQSIEIGTVKKGLQTRIDKLQERMNIIKYQISELQSLNIQQIIQSEIKISISTAPGQLLSHTTTTNREDISVKVRYNHQQIYFKVLKSMHISSTPNIRSTVMSRISSRNTSKANSRVNSRSPIKNEKASSRPSISHMENVKAQATNERILGFGKNKLILKKQHPHFHEEIEVKRIMGIKITNDSTVHVYFKKGYMMLEFLSGMLAKNGRESEDQNIVRRNRISMAKQWIKCFRSAYCQQIDNIKFANQIYETNSEVKTSKRNSQESSKYSYQNKENIQQNFCSFSKCNNPKQHKPVLEEKAFEEEIQIKARSMLPRRERYPLV